MGTAEMVPEPVEEGDGEVGEMNVQREEKEKTELSEETCTPDMVEDSQKEGGLAEVHNGERDGEVKNTGESRSSAERAPEEVNAEKPASWAGLFNHRNKANDDWKLQYVAPEEINCGKVARISKDDSEKGVQLWKNSLVGYFIGRRQPFKIVETATSKMWRLKGSVTINVIHNGFYLFSFSCCEDRKMILEEGPWFISRNPLILKPWDPSFSFTKEDDAVPLWVRFPSLPLHLWTDKSLSSIANVIGTPLFCDDQTRMRSRLAYARVCIEVKAMDGCLDVVKICDNGRCYDQFVEYDWKPPYCPICKTFNHVVAQCGKSKPAPKPVWVRKVRENAPNKDSTEKEASRNEEDVMIVDQIQSTPRDKQDEVTKSGSKQVRKQKEKAKDTFLSNVFEVLLDTGSENVQDQDGEDKNQFVEEGPMERDTLMSVQVEEGRGSREKAIEQSIQNEVEKQPMIEVSGKSVQKGSTTKGGFKHSAKSGAKINPRRTRSKDTSEDVESTKSTQDSGASTKGKGKQQKSYHA